MLINSKQRSHHSNQIYKYTQLLHYNLFTEYAHTRILKQKEMVSKHWTGTKQKTGRVNT